MKDRYILLVEDNPDDIELTLRAFERNNVANKLIVVTDGEEALEYIFCTGKYSSRKIEHLPSVILLDIQLPKIDGLEVLERLRSDERTKYTPVVILTSSREEQDMVDSYRLGANSYIRKPVDFNKFSEAILQLRLYWLVLNEPPPEQ